jgi:type II secretory pathway component GspD/PulD (secretin)
MNKQQERSMRALKLVLIVTMAVLPATSTRAQNPSQPPSQPAAQANTQAAATEARRPDQACATSLRSFALKNATQPNDGNEIQTALRNMLPSTTHIYFAMTQNTILVCAPPDLQAVAERVVRELDKPRSRYKITYTFTESDGGKRMGTQHFTMLVTAGQRMTVKEGSRVPIATGTYTPGGASSVQTQFQYIDVGMNFDVTLSETAAGALLKTKVEQSSMVQSSPPMQPVVRQLSFEGSPTLVAGKPAIVTSLDMPESTRHVDVEVVMEPVQ